MAQIGSQSIFRIKRRIEESSGTIFGSPSIKREMGLKLSSSAVYARTLWPLSAHATRQPLMNRQG